jgi:hypothetical protein
VIDNREEKLDAIPVQEKTMPKSADAVVPSSVLRRRLRNKKLKPKKKERKLKKMAEETNEKDLTDSSLESEKNSAPDITEGG